MKQGIRLHPSVIKNGIATYDFRGLKISFCTAPDKKNNIKLTDYFDTCRETVVSFLRNQLENGRPIKGNAKSEVEIDLRKTRLVLYAKDRNDNTKLNHKKFAKRKNEEIAEGLKLVNYFEKRHGWLLTKVTKLDWSNITIPATVAGINDTLNMYMVVGSNKWLRSPHVLSLYMLFLRLGIRGFKGNYKTHEKFAESVETFISKNTGNYKDASHVKDTHRMWDILLKNHGKLFRNRTVKRLYNSKYLVNKSTGFSEGITKLCKGLSNDLEITERFAKFCNSEGIPLKSKVKLKITTAIAN